MVTFRRFTLFFFLMLFSLNLWMLFSGKSTTGFIYEHASFLYVLLAILYFGISFTMAFLPCSNFHHPVICRGRTDGNKIALTFDDGPDKVKTPLVLEILDKYNVPATFFCIGKNIEKQPRLFDKLISEGHAIGNHTFNHLKGWDTPTETYLENVEWCNLEIQKFENLNSESKLFRPPYGKIKSSQSKILRQLGYKIIMWDVLSADFDQTISPEQCLKNVLEKAESGSIIVFHDSVKAFPNLEYTLPKALAFLEKKGFVFDVIK